MEQQVFDKLANNQGILGQYHLNMKRKIEDIEGKLR